MFSNKIKKFCFLIFVLSVYSVIEIDAQQIYWLKNPTRSIIPTHLNTSQFDGMGLIEIAKRDPIREIFINPATIVDLEKDVLFLSVLSFNKDQNYYYNQDYYTEEFNSKLGYTNLPLGGIFKFDRFSIGGLIAYGFEEKRERYFEKYSYSSVYYEHFVNSQASDLLYQFFTGFELSDAFSAGLSFSGQNKNYDEVQKKEKVKKIMIPRNLSFGLKFSLTPTDVLSFSALNYNLRDELTKYRGTIWSYQMYKTPYEQKGWKLTLDYSKYFPNKININSRIEYDLSNHESIQTFNGGLISSNSSKTANLKAGIGFTKEEGDLEFAGEVFYESFNFKQKINDLSSIPPGWFIKFEDEDQYSSWRFRLGMKTAVADFLDFHIGTEYITEQEKKIKDASRWAFNFGDLNSFNLTAGLNARINNILIIYSFIYRNEFYDYQSMNFDKPISQLMKSNPTEQRFALRYVL